MGDQSGMVKLSPRSLSKTPLIMAITALIGVLHSSTRALKALPKMSFTPCHACRQLPENTPVMKVMRPLKIPWMKPMIFPIPVANTLTPASRAGMTTLPTFKKTVISP